MTPQEEFVKICLPHAKAVQLKRGFHYLIPLTQGAHESGWKIPAGYNLFGIKDTDGINGNEQLITTTEYSKSPNLKFPVIIHKVFSDKFKKWKYLIKDYFRKYSTIEDAFNNHCDFFEKNTRYAEALQYKMDPVRFFEEISKAGYATDPMYSTNLKNVMNSVIKRLPK